MTTVNCLRCNRLAVLDATDEDGNYVENSDVTLRDGGLLTYVCPEHLTDEEVRMVALRSAAALLDVAESAIADLDMLASRIPGTKDRPEFKRFYAQAQVRADEARASIRALTEDDDGA